MALNLTIKQGSENYAATIVEIKNIFPIEGADKIQRCVVNGNDVVVSKDVKIGDKMLYFVSGTKLNQEYCKNNNLYSDKEYNINSEAKPGYFSKSRRTKALKLKGIISDGILLPLSSLEYINNL
jgi:tRNA-binding EMAP/Myf-like protein